MKVILASASPRRKELLKQMGIVFDVVPSRSEERIDPGTAPCTVAMELAFQKAMDVAKGINEKAVIIGADTIVVMDDEILGKPKDERTAFRMLLKLQGKTHEVITGLAVIETGSGKWVKDYERTLVRMAHLSEDEINRYIETGEPMDKAGAYGIQGLGGLFVQEIHGCYYNVVGLPIHLLWKILKGMGIETPL